MSPGGLGPVKDDNIHLSAYYRIGFRDVECKEMQENFRKHMDRAPSRETPESPMLPWSAKRFLGLDRAINAKPCTQFRNNALLSVGSVCPER